MLRCSIEENYTEIHKSGCRPSSFEEEGGRKGDYQVHEDSPRNITS